MKNVALKSCGFLSLRFFKKDPVAQLNRAAAF